MDRIKQMINLFRRRYPLGSIISELLQVEHGKYLVRVSVQVEGTTLATGLAADITIEQAEDNARMRALALLNLEQTAIPPDVIDTNHHQSTEQVPYPTSVKLAPESSVKAVKTEKTKKAPEPKPEPQQINLEPIPNNGSQDLEETVALPFEEISSTLSIPPLEESKPATLIPNGDITEEIIDFADVIAKIDVEMKRLGWTKEQGREYLLQTYGKKSRQMLQDDELVGFLRYLESQ